MTPLRIFISSVQKEFAAERAALRDFLRGDALLRRFFDVFLFEDLPASDRRVDEVYLGEVERCDVFVGLFGDTYGFEDTAGISPTEREFDHATKLGRPRLIFVRSSDDAARHKKMRALILRAGDQVIRRRFIGIGELNASVYASLVDHLERTGRLRTGPFDSTASPGIALADIDEKSVNTFLARAQATRGYALAPGTPVADALTHLNLLEDGAPNHAAVLLFGREPQRTLPTSIVKCLHFHGTEIRKPIPSHQEYRGTVFELVDQAVNFVLSNLDRRVGTRAESNAVPVSYEIPREAVAEAVVNAIAHRDYASNASVQVMLFSDRLEIWNPGELPAGLSPARLAKPHASIPRNPLLAGPLFLAGYIEQAGTGTLDMIALSREAGLKAPLFKQDGAFFVQTLWREVVVPTGQATGQVTEQATAQDKQLIEASLDQLAQVLGIPTAQATAQAAAQVAKVLNAASQDMGNTRDDLQTAADIEHREHFRKAYLEPLVTAGWLERTIPDKPTSPNQRYRVTTAGRAWLKTTASQVGTK